MCVCVKAQLLYNNSHIDDIALMFLTINDTIYPLSIPTDILPGITHIT